MFSKSCVSRALGAILICSVIPATGSVGLFRQNAVAAETVAGPVVKEILVVGNKTVKSDDIKYRMRTRVGNKLDNRVLDEDFKRLLKMGNFADIQIHQEKVSGGIRLRVVVKEKAVIRRVLFRGNKQVTTKTLKKKVGSKVGQLYDAGVVNRDVRAIEDWYRSEYYYFTKVEAIQEPFEDGIRLVYDITERGRVTVKDIIFHGNKSIDKSELTKNMAVQSISRWPWGPRGKYERRAFEQDLERIRLFYQTKGYLDVKVTERPFQITAKEADSKWEQRHMVIHIDIEEGEVYHIGKIDFNITTVGGKKGHSPEELRELLTVMPGEVYNSMEVSKNAGLIRDFYGENGRYFSTVRPRRVTAETGTVADVIFDIKEDKPVVIDEILVTGLNHTKEYVVRRELEMFPGEVYNTKQKRESEWNLNRLNFFERPVNIDIKKTGEGRGKVVVDLKEKRTGSLSGGVGYSTSDGVVGSFKLKERNFDHRGKPTNLKELLTLSAFKGAGEMLSLDISAGSKTSSYSLDFLNPWIFNRPIRFGSGVFRNSREWDDYDEYRTGVYFTVGRKIFGKLWDISGTYKLENSKLDNFDSDFHLYEDDEEANHTISRGIVRLAYDTRDDLYDPTSGWYGHVTQEVAGGVFGGEVDFWKTRSEINYWLNFFTDKRKRPHVLAFRVEGAIADGYGRDNELPLNERLYAGGLGSLRGFSYNSVSPVNEGNDAIGGGGMITSSAEYFFPLLGTKLRGSIFYDVGNVYQSADDLNGDTWRSSTGVGIHVQTPMWQMPIGIYYSDVLSKESYDADTKTIQIRMGAYF